MSETLSVNIDTSKDNAKPTLEELAEKLDETNPPAPSDEERPEWLPEKFRSPPDMAKAYAELERKLSSSSPDKEEEEHGEEDEASDDEVQPETANEAAKEAVENAGLNFDELSNKYWDKGGLEDADYKALEKAGIPKNVVDQFIAGQQAVVAQTRQTVFNTVGGEEVYTSMQEWAADTLSKSEIDAYNRAVDSGNMDTAMMAVKGLKARFEAEAGYEPRTSAMGDGTSKTASVYRSVAELQVDMANPLYQKDPAFRRDVENKLSRSDIM